MFVDMINEVRSAGKMLALDVSAVIRVCNFGVVIVVYEIELSHCWIGCNRKITAFHQFFLLKAAHALH